MYVTSVPPPLTPPLSSTFVPTCTSPLLPLTNSYGRRSVKAAKEKAVGSPPSSRFDNDTAVLSRLAMSTLHRSNNATSLSELVALRAAVLTTRGLVRWFMLYLSSVPRFQLVLDTTTIVALKAQIAAEGKGRGGLDLSSSRLQSTVATWLGGVILGQTSNGLGAALAALLCPTTAATAAATSISCTPTSLADAVTIQFLHGSAVVGLGLAVTPTSVVDVFGEYITHIMDVGTAVIFAPEIFERATKSSSGFDMQHAAALLNALLGKIDISSTAAFAAANVAVTSYLSAMEAAPINTGNGTRRSVVVAAALEAARPGIRDMVAKALKDIADGAIALRPVGAIMKVTGVVRLQLCIPPFCYPWYPQPITIRGTHAAHTHTTTHNNHTHHTHHTHTSHTHITSHSHCFVSHAPEVLGPKRFRSLDSLLRCPLVGSPLEH